MPKKLQASTMVSNGNMQNNCQKKYGAVLVITEVLDIFVIVGIAPPCVI